MTQLYKTHPEAPLPPTGLLPVEMVDYAAGEFSDAPQSEYVVCLVTNGHGKVRSRLNGGRSSEMVTTPGSFLPIVPPGFSADFQMFAPMRHLVLRIPPDCLARASDRDTGGAASLDQLFESGFSDPLLVELAKRLLIEQADSGTGDDPMSAALLDTFCLLLCRTAAAKPAREVTGPKLRSAQTRDVRAFLEDNIARKLTLADIASAHGMSERQFSKAFKAATGTTPRQYLIDLRIERAKQHLRAGDLDMIGIAEATGFSDQAHLTATFARRVGTSPARYRRSLQ